MRLRDVVEDDEVALYADPVAAEQMRLVGLPDPKQFKNAYHRVLETHIPDALGHLMFRILRRSCAPQVQKIRAPLFSLTAYLRVLSKNGQATSTLSHAQRAYAFAFG